MTTPTPEALEAARELAHAVLNATVYKGTPDEGVQAIATALTAAHEAGRREEREACIAIAESCGMPCDECIDAMTNLGARTKEQP